VWEKDQVSGDDYYMPDVLTYPTFTELNAMLVKYFEVTASAIEYSMPTFAFRWSGGIVPSVKEQTWVFEEIDAAAEKLKVWPVVRWRNKKAGEYVARFVPIQKEPKSDIRINYALFVATMGTIAIGGFMQATSPVFLTLFYPGGWTAYDIAFVALTFILSIMGIFFTHEMGHYLTAKRRGVEATPPYFIPGIPDLGGTFGAFIQQKSPPKHRRDLFDLGIAGPIAGFAVTLVVLFVGYALSVPVTAEQLAAIDAAFPNMTGELGVPLIFTVLDYIFVGFIPEGGTLYLHPIGFAAWVGCLVTSLNLFPTSQLDGGHALRAVVASDKHKYIGWAAIALMAMAGFFLMAVLVILLSQGREHPGPLNDTIPISRGRVVLFIIAMAILVLAIPPLGLVF
jgi:hypothetical protein